SSPSTWSCAAGCAGSSNCGGANSSSTSAGSHPNGMGGWCRSGCARLFVASSGCARLFVASSGTARPTRPTRSTHSPPERDGSRGGDGVSCTAGFVPAAHPREGIPMLVLDLAYLLALLILSPWLLWRALATGRYRTNLAAKLLGRVSVPNPGRKPVAWFHAVSVGEVNLLGTLVPAFRDRHPDWLVVVSSTTDTGLAEARKRFADLSVIAWPFDFSWAVGNALDAVKPALVVLAESELWPNFLRAAGRRNVPVVVVNARMSPRSFGRLRRAAGLARRLLFDRVARFAVQEAEYADRLRALGGAADRPAVTGATK